MGEKLRWLRDADGSERTQVLRVDGADGLATLV